jgi:hypothetical protein
MSIGVATEKSHRLVLLLDTIEHTHMYQFDRSLCITRLLPSMVIVRHETMNIYVDIFVRQTAGC